MRMQYSILCIFMFFAVTSMSACAHVATVSTPSPVQESDSKSARRPPDGQQQTKEATPSPQESTILAQVEKWVRNSAIIISLCSAAFTFLNFRASRQRNELDVQVKMLEQYWKVMEKRATLLVTSSNKTLSAWRDFYRAYCDLLWMEYYLWDKGVLGDKLFFIWLSYAQNRYWENFDYLDENDRNQKKMLFKNIWAELTSSAPSEHSYFDPGDDFVGYMNKIFAEEAKNKPIKDIPGAQKQKSLWHRLSLAK